METGFMNRIIGLVLALVVGGLLVGGLLIPSIEGMTTTEKTFENEGAWRMKLIEEGDHWEYADDSWTFNDTPQNIPKNSSNALLGEDWCVRSNGQVRGSTMRGNVSDLTATAQEITITFTGVGGTAIQSLPGYGVDATNGAFIMSNYGAPVYMNGESPVFATGNSVIDEIDTMVHIEATIKDGATISVEKYYNGPELSNIVVDNVSVNYETIDGYKDLYKLNSITANITFDTDVDNDGTPESHTGDITFSSYVVPYAITAELSQHMTPTEIAMFGVISILGIVALVVLAANGIRNKY